MRKALIALTTAASLCSTIVASPARAGGGEVAAGIVGGLAVGTMLGAAAARPRPYYAPAPVYVAPGPVYAAPPLDCYWTRGEPVWDPYRGIWRRPRVRVCD